MKLKIGVDDAGRGPVIGPMILAGCLIDEKMEDELRRIGVKDSKLLTAKRREKIAEEIRNMVLDYSVKIVSPKEIDDWNEKGLGLNELEAIKVAEIINELNKGKKKAEVVVDCPSRNCFAWREFLIGNIKDEKKLKVLCEHKADFNHVSVAAGSILAKSEREKEMTKLRKKYGEEIGSGYTSDKKSVEFLKNNINKLDKKRIFRRSWATWKRIKEEGSQRRL